MISVSEALKTLLSKETKVVVLTGAGISAESGVPTFRGEDGLWKKFRPEELATFDAFMANPELVWEWYEYRRKIIEEIKPNPAHLALVEFQNHFEQFDLITQNVDGLHNQAGSKNVVELHGNIKRNKCIRCGACLNTCPVYRRSGGHSYGYTIPGPIGSILTPRVDLKAFSDLPYASSLCGSCSDVCPVKIEIHEQLYHWRQEVNEQGELSRKKKLGIRFMGRLLARPRLYQKSGKFARKALRITPRFLVYNRLNPWGLSRDLPEPPRQSFQEWYRENRNKS